MNSEKAYADLQAAVAEQVAALTEQRGWGFASDAEQPAESKGQPASIEVIDGHDLDYVTVDKLYNILTAALAGKMGHAAVTVKGQRFRSMALRISYTIGGEDGEPTAELVAEPL